LFITDDDPFVAVEGQQLLLLYSVVVPVALEYRLVEFVVAPPLPLRPSAFITFFPPPPSNIAVSGDCI
jgi:hypothetical protein